MKEKKYLVIIFLFLPSFSFACPLCTTSVGIQVREGIFNQHFLANFFLVTLPFIIFLLITLFIYYGIPIKRR